MGVKVLVKTSTGKTLTFSFTEEEFESATVLQLKKKFLETEGTPEDQQRLIFAGRLLEDQRLLSDCGVKHESTVYLVLRRVRDRKCQFFVRMLTGKDKTITFTEEEFESATVEHLKTKIREIEGIAEDQQRLLFAGQQLEDDRRLSNYGVKSEDRPIECATAPSGPPSPPGYIKACMRWTAQQKHTDLCGCAMESFSSDSQPQSTELSHAEVSAEVESTERVMKIKVCEWGKKMAVDLCVTEEQLKSMTVLQLKEKIEPLFGLSVRDQQLLINGELLAGGRMLFHSDRYMWLDDDKLLSDYGIRDGSAIHLSKVIWAGSSGWRGGGMGDRDGRNKSMECVAIMLTGSDVSSESAAHPQPAAVEDLHKDSC